MAIAAKRRNDAILTVCQNNAAQRIEIREANMAAEILLGYTQDELLGRTLDQFLPDKLRGLMSENIEYKEVEGKDFGEVFGKVSDFRIRPRGGGEIPLRLRLVREEIQDGMARFTMLMQDEAVLAEMRQYREAIRETFKGHEALDPATGLPNRASILKDAELIHHHVATKGIDASFALFSIDKFSEMTAHYGAESAPHILRALGMLLKNSLRWEDTVGYMDGDKLGVILMDATYDASQIVLNRMRWLIQSQLLDVPGFGRLPVTVSIGFAAFSEEAEEATLEASEAALKKAQAKGGNHVAG